jgi:hypothetical protein
MSLVLALVSRYRTGESDPVFCYYHGEYPPRVLSYVTRIAIEMHNSDRKQDGIH